MSQPDNTITVATLPGPFYSSSSGLKHSLSVRVSARADPSDSKPTINKIWNLTTELEATPAVAFNQFVQSSPYSKGSVLDYFLQLPEVRKECRDNPTVARIAILYHRPIYGLITGIPSRDDYRPFEIEVEAVIERRTSDDIVKGQRLSFVAESLLDRWVAPKSKQVKPGPFTPQDGFRDNSYQRFSTPGSWETGTPHSGLIERQGLKSDDDEPADLRTAFGNGDLKTLPADIRSLKVCSATIPINLALASRFRSLTYLDLFDFRMVDEAGLSFLSQLEKLEHLKLLGEFVTDRTMPAVARLSNLRHLDIIGTRVTAKGIGLLTGLRKLESLRVSGDPSLEGGVFRTVGTMHALKRLDLSFIGEHTDEELVSLASLSNLEELSIGGSHYVTSAGLKVLASLPKLTSLSLSNMKLDDRALDFIAPHSALRTLDLYELSGVTDTGLMKLAGLTNIEWLYVYCPNTTRTALHRLKDALPGNFKFH